MVRRLKRALMLSGAHNLLLLILPKCSVLLVHFNVFKTHISKHMLNLWHITNIIIIILILLLLLSLLLLLLLLCCVKRKPIWPTLKKRTVLWNVTKVNLKKKIKIQKEKSEAHKIQLRNKK